MSNIGGRSGGGKTKRMAVLCVALVVVVWMLTRLTLSPVSDVDHTTIEIAPQSWKPLPRVPPATPLICSSSEAVPVTEAAMTALSRDTQWLPRYVQARVAVFGGKALEIGGTSSMLQLVYPHLATLDNVLYSAKTMWEGSVKEGEGTFSWYAGKPKGRQYVLDATHLSSVASDTYDWVLTCHNVEHIANPFKALMEFHRVLRVGGTLVLLLPQKAHTFDRKRADTELSHMVEDYNSGTAEDDLTHLEEIVEKMSYEHDGGLLAQAKERRMLPHEWLRKRSLNNFEIRGLHQHVFGRQTTQQMLQCIGFRVVGARYDGGITDMYIAEKVAPSITDATA